MDLRSSLNSQLDVDDMVFVHRLERMFDHLRLDAEEVSSQPDDILKVLVSLHQLVGDGRAASDQRCDLPEKIDRFLIRGCLGAGSFGIVLRAYDPQLDREIALKVLRIEAALSTQLRERLKREARAAANLEHPGIVSPHEVMMKGMLCYLAAPLCTGPTLAQWLKEVAQPVNVRQTAELVARIAEAVQHAHARGVIHRDLKPANILLEPTAGHGTALPFIPRVTDFGLAKRLDEEESDTITGMRIGTTAYMSPEQAECRWKDVGTGSDIFALGIILFEMLVGQRPFNGESCESTRSQIIHEQPGSLRAARRDIPWELEAICFKCLEKSPTKRYASAHELANDLRCYLEDRPIQASPPGPLRRTLLWCRRRPAISLLCVVLVAVSLISLFVIIRSFERERLARIDSDEKLEMARDAVKRMYTRVSEGFLSREPGTQDIRRELLGDALRIHRRIAETRPNDLRSKHEFSYALHRHANILKMMGQLNEAVATRQECIVVVEGLIKKAPREKAYRFDRFSNLLWREGEQVRIGKKEEARKSLYAAEEQIRNLVDEDPSNVVYQDALAALCHDLGVRAHSDGRSSQAAEFWQESLVIAEKFVKNHPEHFVSAKHAATSYSALAIIAAEQNNLELARSHCQQAEALVAKIRQVFPEESWCDDLEFAVKRNHVNLLVNRQLVLEAHPQLLDCHAAIERLIKFNPKTSIYYSQRGMTFADLGRYWLAKDNEARAREFFAQAVEDYQYVMENNPEEFDATRQMDDLKAFCPFDDLISNKP